MHMENLKPLNTDNSSPDNFNELVSQERSQKFDLLVHLINNLAKPIVVSGAEGIGKTTFLKHLASHPQKGWEVCHLIVTDKVDLDTIKKKMLESTGDLTPFQHRAETINALTRKLTEFSDNNKLLVLILDNAEGFEPDLLKTLLEFVKTQPALRLVFSSQPDNPHIKTSTDYDEESCHFIDIPPLNEQDTKNYLRMPPLGMPEDTITPDLLTKVHRQSQGIPGSINSVVSELTQPKIQKKTNQLLPAAIGAAVLIAIAISYFLWKPDSNKGTDLAAQNVSQKKDTENHKVIARQPNLLSAENTESVEKITAAKQNSKALDDLLTDIASTTADVDGEIPLERSEGKVGQKTAQLNKNVAMPLPQISAGEPKPVQGKKEAAIVRQESKRELSVNSSNNQTRRASTPKVQAPRADAHNTTIAKNKQQTDRSPPKTTSNRSKVVLNDKNWLLNLNPQHFTLQLMASTDIADLHDFVAKYPQLKPFGYYRARKGKTDWYRLLYGDFPTLKAAKGEALKLPSALRKAWPRSLATVQKATR